MTDQYRNVRVCDRGVLHLYDDDAGGFTTLCGQYAMGPDAGWVPFDGFTDDTCLTCRRVAWSQGYLHFRGSRPDHLYASDDALAKGLAMAHEERVKVAPAAVYRVLGDTDTYTVTLIIDPLEHGVEWAACTCMAGKTRPDRACKHVVAVVAERMQVDQLKGGAV